jgi:uncharacterized protein (TIGR02147 family)
MNPAMEVFKVQDYRALVQAMLIQRHQATKSGLAQTLDCSPSWVTRVLGESVQFTPDQALGVCEYFGFNENETEYFLALVDLERAATPSLKRRIETKLASMRAAANQLSLSIKTESSVSEAHRVQYYSSWIYAAIHVATMVQKKSLEEIARMLRIDGDIALRVLTDLQEMGLVLSQAGKFQATSVEVHLPGQHPMATIAHANWRHRTAQQIMDRSADGLHYTGVHCLSQKDFEIVKKTMKDVIIESRRLIELSSPELSAILCLDWYNL